MSSVTGSPQNKADKPRTSRPKARNSSTFAASIPFLNGEVGVFLEAPLVIVQQAHAFRRFETVGFYRFVNLHLHLPLQFVLVILHRSQRLPDGRTFDDFFHV